MQAGQKHDNSPHTNFPLWKCEIELCILCLSHTLALIDTECPIEIYQTHLNDMFVTKLPCLHLMVNIVSFLSCKRHQMVQKVFWKYYDIMQISLQEIRNKFISSYVPNFCHRQRKHFLLTKQYIVVILQCHFILSCVELVI